MQVPCPNCKVAVDVPRKLMERGVAQMVCPDCAFAFVVRLGEPGEGSSPSKRRDPTVPLDIDGVKSSTETTSAVGEIGDRRSEFIPSDTRTTIVISPEFKAQMADIAPPATGAKQDREDTQQRAGPLTDSGELAPKHPPQDDEIPTAPGTEMPLTDTSWPTDIPTQPELDVSRTLAERGATASADSAVDAANPPTSVQSNAEPTPPPRAASSDEVQVPPSIPKAQALQAVETVPEPGGQAEGPELADIGIASIATIRADDTQPDPTRPRPPSAGYESYSSVTGTSQRGLVASGSNGSAPPAADSPFSSPLMSTMLTDAGSPRPTWTAPPTAPEHKPSQAAPAAPGPPWSATDAPAGAERAPALQTGELAWTSEPRPSGLARVIGLLMLFVLVSVALFATFVLYRNDWRFDIDRIDVMLGRAFGSRSSSPGRASAQGLELTSPVASAGKLADGTAVLMAQGIVKNVGHTAKRFVYVRAQLKRYRSVVAAADAPAGNMFTAPQLAKLDRRGLRASINPAGRDGRNAMLEPGQTIAYMVVLTELPQDYRDGDTRFEVTAEVSQAETYRVP